jgi:hypothetical protein
MHGRLRHAVRQPSLRDVQVDVQVREAACAEFLHAMKRLSGETK